MSYGAFTIFKTFKDLFLIYLNSLRKVDNL